jgi:hypothetical protein
MFTSINQEKVFDTYNQNDSEELEEPGAVAPKYRGTVADRKDMSVMGKKQVLRVCCLRSIRAPRLTIIAKLSLPHDVRFREHCDGQLGDFVAVSMTKTN